MQRICRFIPNGKGYQFVGRQMSFRGLLPPIWTKLSYNELVNVAYTNKIELIGGTHDSIVDISPMKHVCNCKLYELNGGHSLFLDKSLHIKLIDIIDDFKSDKPKSKIARNK
jgi:hypothetical protein